MNIKTNMQILSEMASIDNQIQHEAEIDVNTVMEAYNAVPECTGITVTEASDVVVTPVGDDYYVEMVNLAPFMLDSGIKSVAKALDMVAEANGLDPKSVGLVVESKSSVDRMLNDAKDRARKIGNDRIRENAIIKVEKNNNIIKRLMSEGYKVCSKREGSKVCEGCGKEKSKCECDASGSASGSNAVIAEKGCDKAEKKIAEQVEQLNEALNAIWNDDIDATYLSESEINSILEEKVIKSKQEVENLLNDLDKKPNAIDHILNFFKNFIKYIAIHAGAGTAFATASPATAVKTATGR